MNFEIIRDFVINPFFFFTKDIRIQFFSYFYLILFYSILWVPILWEGSKKKIALGRSISKNQNLNSHYIYYNTILPILLVVSSVALLSIRYFDGITPRGWDTPWYIAILNLMQKSGISVAFGTDRPIFFLFVYTAKSFLEISSNHAMILAPIIFGTVYTVSTYFFLAKLTENHEFATVGAFIVLISSYTLRISQDLHANLFALSLQLGFFYYFLKSQDDRNISRERLISALLLIIIAFSHVGTWIPAVLTLSIFTVLNGYKNLENLLRRVYSLFIVVFPSLILYSAFLFNPLKSSETVGAAHISLASSLSPSLPSLEAVSAALVSGAAAPEHVIIALFAIGGVITISFSEKGKFETLMISWLFAASILTIFFFNNDRLTFRTMFQYPFGIFAGVYLYRFSEKITRHYPHNVTRILKPCIIGIFLFIIVVDNLPHAFPIEPRPSSEAMDQLIWIQNNYDTNKTIVLVDNYLKGILRNRMHWSMALVGPNVYLGRLYSFLAQQPDTIEMRPNIGENAYINVAVMEIFNEKREESFSNYNDFTILIPNALYEIGALEYPVIQETKRNGIYVVDQSKLSIIDDLIEYRKNLTGGTEFLYDNFDINSIDLGIWSKGFFEDGIISTENSYLRMSLGWDSIGSMQSGTGVGIVSYDIFSRPSTVEIRFKFDSLPSPKNDNSIHFSFYRIPGTATYEAEYQFVNGHRHWHIKKVKGTEIKEVAIFPWEPDMNWHDMTLKLEKDSAYFLLDGSEIAMIPDSEVTPFHIDLSLHTPYMISLDSWSLLIDYVKVY